MRSTSGKVTGNTLAANEWNESGASTEAQNVVQSADITLDNTGSDLNQLSEAISNYVARGDFYNDIGAANTYVLSPAGNLKSPKAYGDGFKATFAVANLNTGASTVNVNSIGTKQILLNGVALVGGELVADRVVDLRFDLAGDAFELVNVFSGAADLLPSLDNTYDVGSPSLRWKTGYFSDAMVIEGVLPGYRLVNTGSGINAHFENFYDITTTNRLRQTVVQSDGTFIANWMTADINSGGTDIEKVDIWIGGARKLECGVGGSGQSVTVTFGNFGVNTEDFTTGLAWDRNVVVEGTNAGFVARDTDNTRNWEFGGRANNFVFYEETDNRTYWTIQGGAGDLFPGITNTFDIGSGSFRVQTIFLQNSPDVTSDQDLKTDLTAVDDQLLDALQPLLPQLYKLKTNKAKGDERIEAGYIAQHLVTAMTDAGIADPFGYRFINRNRVPAEMIEQIVTVKRAVKDEVEIDEESFEAVNGKAKRTIKKIKKKKERFNLMPAVSGNGQPIYQTGIDRKGKKKVLKDKKGNKIPVMVKMQVFENVSVTETVPKQDGQGNDIMKDELSLNYGALGVLVDAMMMREITRLAARVDALENP